jgi:hypothetical protein
MLGTIVLAALLSGCNTAKLSDLDREFVSLYQTKVDYRLASDGLFLPPDALSQSFADLSDRAAAGAQALPADALAAQVAYWRVATLASWQAGEQGEAVVIDRADSGGKACAALRASNKDAPRDCLLIEIAGPLARQDATLRDMQALIERLGPGPTYPDSERPKFASFFDDFIGRLSDLGEVRKRTYHRTPVPDAFWPRFNRQMLIVSCNANKAREYARQAGASMAELTEMFARLESTAKATGIEQPGVLYSAGSCLDLANSLSALGVEHK